MLTAANAAPYPWSATERESFFDAIDRHRRATWRVTAICALAVALLALVESVLLAPLFYCVAGLLLDLVNLLVPMPDLLGMAGRVLGPIVDAPEKASLASLGRLLVLAALPGCLAMALAAWTVDRAMKRSALFGSASLPGRPANPTVLAEQRMHNTVVEMALAAGLPAPQVRLLDGSANAAAFGLDEAHATVLVGADLLTGLSRDQLQAIAAHLVASIANGDMRIGVRAAGTLGLFALMSRLGTGLMDTAANAATLRLCRALLVPGAANAAFIADQLSDPLDPGSAQASVHQPMPDSGLTRRQWAMMPLMGPLAMSGLFCGMVSSMMLTPMVAWAWRHRKYLADATAVRLARDANGLRDLLLVIGESRPSLHFDQWAQHLCLVNGATLARIGQARQGGGPLARSYVSVFPAIARRCQALVRLGAHAEMPANAAPVARRRSMPARVAVLVVPLLAAAAVLMVIATVGIVGVSLALSGLFTIVPASLLHALLR